MAPKKTYPRVTHGGTTYILLFEANSLRKLTLTDMNDDRETLYQMIRIFRGYLSVAKQWFFIDTGRQLFVFNTEGTTYEWAVRDARKNAQDFRWLSCKARRYESRIVERLNDAVAREAVDGGL